MYRLILIVGIIFTTSATAKPQQAPATPNPSQKCMPAALPQLTSAFTCCMDSNKFTIPEMKDVSEVPKFLTDFEKSSFNDNGFSKCLGDQLKLITPDNKLNRAEFAKVIKISNAPDEFTKTVEKVWTTCADTVEAKMKDNTDMKKIAAMFGHCVVKSLYDQRDSIPKC